MQLTRSVSVPEQHPWLEALHQTLQAGTLYGKNAEKSLHLSIKQNGICAGGEYSTTKLAMVSGVRTEIKMRSAAMHGIASADCIRFYLHKVASTFLMHAFNG